MTELSDIEKQLLAYFSDNSLRTSLNMIRQAATIIWGIEAPRVIHDFTDHGLEHSIRLLHHMVKLLEANNGQPLSEQEMYLLLAGIYLHDIGMQCDAVKLPKIKSQAEKLGAQFDIEFTAQTASQYGTHEQKAIRKNHHYLAAAWIDYAYRTGDTPLGSSAKTVPRDLIADLMDVCMYHAKLSIADCPPKFKFDSNQRKQLVAALLRFSDELDIDAHRVNIETVKAFSLDPLNSAYWWLHSCSRIVFSNRYVITLTLLLHPDDVHQYGLFVNEAFIEEFRRKNRQTLSVLAKHDIPITIDDASKVEEHEYAEKLPLEIVQALKIIGGEWVEKVKREVEALEGQVATPSASPALRDNLEEKRKEAVELEARFKEAFILDLTTFCEWKHWVEKHQGAALDFGLVRNCLAMVRELKIQAKSDKFATYFSAIETSGLSTVAVYYELLKNIDNLEKFLSGITQGSSHNTRVLHDKINTIYKILQTLNTNWNCPEK